MGRRKTIADAELLEVAREVFQTLGHAASTREIAHRAGISEAVLYQRFGTKEEMFFAAMAPGAPDVEHILGPEEPQGDARAYLGGVIARLVAYFSEIVPIALFAMTHPSFDHAGLAKAQATPARLRDGLARRLGRLAERGSIRRSVEAPTAQLIVSLAHDIALWNAMSWHAPGHDAGLAHGARPRPDPAGPKRQDLEPLLDLVWNGAAPKKQRARAPSRARMSKRSS
jgi:AcrR family transcriptional regulator